MPPLPQTHSFTAVIETTGTGAYVSIPLDVEAVFGKKRVPVTATFDAVEYRGSIVRMGSAGHIIGITKAVLGEMGKRPGDTAAVTITEDLSERTVDIPDDLAAAMADAPGAEDYLKSLSYTRQREYVLWIESAKRDATRSERISKTVANLVAGKPLRG